MTEKKYIAPDTAIALLPLAQSYMMAKQRLPFVMNAADAIAQRCKHIPFRARGTFQSKIEFAQLHYWTAVMRDTTSLIIECRVQLIALLPAGQWLRLSDTKAVDQMLMSDGQHLYEGP